MDNLIKNLILIWPALCMGALVPCAVLLTLFFSKKKKKISFTSALYGFGTFFVVLVAVAVLLLIISQVFLGNLSISDEAEANTIIYVGGSIVLVLFWVISEFLKIISFESALKSEKTDFVGTTFGCGFVLAQNSLIFGLIFLGSFDISNAFAFGLLMLISGVIYILISTVGYQLTLEKQRLAGSAIAISYFALFAMMLFFSNVYITYGTVVAVLAFNLVVAYITLPLPFKKKKEDTV